MLSLPNGCKPRCCCHGSRCEVVFAASWPRSRWTVAAYAVAAAGGVAGGLVFKFSQDAATSFAAADSHPRRKEVAALIVVLFGLALLEHSLSELAAYLVKGHGIDVAHQLVRSIRARLAALPVTEWKRRTRERNATKQALAQATTHLHGSVVWSFQAFRTLFAIAVNLLFSMAYVSTEVAVVWAASIVGGVLGRWATRRCGLGPQLNREAVADGRLAQRVAESFDNLVLGNQLNVRCWTQEVEGAMAAQRGAHRAAWRAQLGDLLFNVCLYGPVIGGALWWWVLRRGEAEFGTREASEAFFVIWRAFQVVEVHVKVLFELHAGFLQSIDRFAADRRALSQPAQVDAARLHRSIQAARIHVEAPDRSHATLQALGHVDGFARLVYDGTATDAAQPVRVYTVRGDNGAGKSLLLTLLAHQLRSLYHVSVLLLPRDATALSFAEVLPAPEQRTPAVGSWSPPPPPSSPSSQRQADASYRLLAEDARDSAAPCKVHDLSTGQGLEAQLEQIMDLARARRLWRSAPSAPVCLPPAVLLLDEWSSSLSDARFPSCRDKLLRGHPAVRVIVEVVHPSHTLQDAEAP